MSICSVNAVRDGKVAKSKDDICGKLWSALHPLDGQKFLAWVEERYPNAIEQEACSSWINHRNYVFDPEELIGSFDQYLIHQQPRDMVITYSNAIHFGVNSKDGPTFAESINFAPLTGEQFSWTEQSFRNLRTACWGRCAELPVVNVSLLLAKFDEDKKIYGTELDTEWVIESRLSLVLQDVEDVLNGKRMEGDKESAGLEMLRDAAERADARKVQELLSFMSDEKSELGEIRARLSDTLNLDFDEEEFIFDDIWGERMDQLATDVKKAKQLTRMFYFESFLLSRHILCAQEFRNHS